jgi:hypothetical protein
VFGHKIAMQVAQRRVEMLSVDDFGILDDLQLQLFELLR